jgi:hypothetical protein
MQDANGVWYTYTGKASMASDSKVFNPQQVFEGRYSKTKKRLRRDTTLGKTLDLDFNNIAVLHEFWDDGSPSDILSKSTGRLRTKGEVTAQALEEFYDAKSRNPISLTLNKNRPLDPDHPRAKAIQDVGANYLSLSESLCEGAIPSTKQR